MGGVEGDRIYGGDIVYLRDPDPKFDCILGIRLSPAECREGWTLYLISFKTYSEFCMSPIMSATSLPKNRVYEYTQS